jgi:light-regulated signal transduction histidine kinase (bacteriophytochrome)
MSHALASAKLHLDRVIAGCDAAITADALPVIPAVPDQMVALFEILLSNCIRFRRQLEPPRIRIGCERSGANWVFHVEDNGIGIDAQYCQSVFLPFRRLQGKEYPGAGMGLATAKLIVELQGGKIRIEPAAEGAVVLFTVPASLSTPAR